MCGIVGSFHPEGRTADAAVVARMRDRMAHRGPDGSGLWCSPDHRCKLAHRCLAIIDLAPEADQPMTNRDAVMTVTDAFCGRLKLNRRCQTTWNRVRECTG